MIACYIIGGDPRLAREYIRWLNACREGALEAGTFEWSQEEIELKNHKVYGGSHKICIAECMVYVTQNSSAVEVLEDPFIKEMSTRGERKSRPSKKSRKSKQRTAQNASLDSLVTS
eukprot:scaffold19662_cov155-Skeletonema_menzelii.AAC.1